MLICRPGTGLMHRLPDALSRTPECRDALNLGRISDWIQASQVMREETKYFAAERNGEDPPLYRFGLREFSDTLT